MKYFKDDGSKILCDRTSPLGSGTSGSANKTSDGKTIKVWYDIEFSDIDARLIKKIGNLKLSNYYRVLSLLYKRKSDMVSANNAIGYLYEYVKKDDIDILTMPIEYTIDNLDVLYNSIAILTKNNIRCLDFQEGNIIINSNNITAIDTDLYYGKYNDTMLAKWNVYDLELLFQYLYEDAMDKYHKGEYSNEVKQLLSSLFMVYDYDGVYGVYRKLKSYKYPIEYVNKLKVLSRG